MNYLANEAFVYAWIVGISIEIAKKMLEKYGENELLKMLEDSGDLDKEGPE